jgi:FkbM family methyltransferase
MPTLFRLLGDADIKLVDVGGRGAAMAQLVPLAPVAHYYTCEPDTEEAQHLQEQLPADTAWRGVTVLTEAIASQRGEASLFLTQQPGMSSLLQPDEHVTQRLYLAPKFGVVRTVTVPAIPLDEAASRYGFTDACFLKIDTQGTELDILQSGPKLVRGSLVAVYVECSFRPFYRGQALFADVDSHLRANGFSLFTMNRANLRRAGYRPGLYSKRMTTWAHCLYLREPDTLVDAPADIARRQLARLLAIALSFDHFDLAFEVLATLGERGLVDAVTLEGASADVERWAGVVTRRMTRKADRQGLTGDTVLAPDLRDRKRLE